MKQINFLSKRAEHFINNYNNSTKTSLRECYKCYSGAKDAAEYQCRKVMHDSEGYDFRIMSYNSMQFTCGWTTKEGDLRIETRDNSYLIVMPF